MTCNSNQRGKLQQERRRLHSLLGSAVCIFEGVEHFRGEFMIEAVRTSETPAYFTRTHTCSCAQSGAQTCVRKALNISVKLRKCCCCIVELTREFSFVTLGVTCRELNYICRLLRAVTHFYQENGRHVSKTPICRDCC
jgi:hypothetical protein